MKKLYKALKYFSIFATQSYSLVGIIDFSKLVANFFIRIRNGYFRVKYNECHLIIRRGTQDAFVFLNVFANKSHRPITGISEPSVIVDLGANVGYTVVDYALLYPKAKVIGVEMNRDNFNIAVENSATLANAIMVNRAVSISDGNIVSYNAEAKEDAFRLSESTHTNGKTIEIETITIDTLLKNYNVDVVDYMKMDIEGEEGEILNHSDLGWLRRVKIIQIEMHPHLNPLASIDEATGILEKNGFDVQKSNLHARAIYAVNRNF